MKSKAVACGLIVALLCGNLPAFAQEDVAETQETEIRFTDVPKEHIAYEAIESLAENGVISGKSEESFAPDDLLKREEFAKILVGAFELAGEENAPMFTDVLAGAWHASYIRTLAASKMVEGVGDGKFGVGMSLSRQDMAVIIKRFLEKENVDLNGGTTIVYADNDKIADYAKDAVEKLSAHDIIVGREDNLWYPADRATRAEAVMAVYNALKFKKEYAASLGKYGPDSQYDGPYDVPKDDRLSELRPTAFNADNYPKLEMAYEDFEDTDYGNLTLGSLPQGVVIEEDTGYDGGNCIKVTGSESATISPQLSYKCEPGELQPGDWVVFSVMMKGEGVAGSGYYTNMVSVYDDKNKWLAESPRTSGFRFNEDSDWFEFQQIVMVKEVANDLNPPQYYSIGLSAYVKNMSGTMYFDNFKLSKLVFPPMDTVLMTPNYKGIVRGEGGIGDIALRVYLNDGGGYYDFDNLRMVNQIADAEHNVIVKSETDDITKVMDVYFSSKDLAMGGDYYIETYIYDKTTGEKIQMRDWPIHKREADFETAIGYDEYGRITKNGEPVFIVAEYVGAPYDKYTSDLVESGDFDVAFHYGMGWYYNWSEEEKGRKYIEKLGENGIGISLSTGNMWLGGGTGEISRRVKDHDDIRGLLSKIVDNFKDLPNLFSYYVWDEKHPVRMGDELEWINRVIESIDLDHPTTAAADAEHKTRPGVYSRTVDFIGYDPYPFTGKPSQDLSLVYDRLMVGKATNPNRPIYLIPQGFFYKTRSGDVSGPSLKEYRNMVFQGLCAGIPMICTYSHSFIQRYPSPGRTPEEEWQIHCDMAEELQYLEPIYLSVLPAPYYEIVGGGEWLNTTARRYNGKSYLFTVNNQGEINSARIYLDGVKSIKGMYSKKTYTADDKGWFDIEWDSYETEIFEYEQADYKSSHAELKRFGLSGFTMADSESEAYFLIPEGTESAEYNCAVSDYAEIFINGEKAQKTGTMALTNLNEIKVKIMSEDGRFKTEKTYPIKWVTGGDK